MKFWLLLLPALGLFASCAPSTPETRIQSNLGAYQGLSEKHKELVRQGRIARGMSPNAVYLAWGRAQNEFVGSDGGTPTRRWDYEGQRAVTTTNFYGGYGYGRYRGYGRYAGYGRRYYRAPFYNYGTGTSVTYVPYHKASVWFEKDRVVKWERRR